MTITIIIISLYLVYHDLRFKKVPNLINLLLFIIVLVNKLILNENMVEPLISGTLAFVTFFLIYIFSKRKIGMGDVKYTAITAIHFGYYFWLKSIIICSATALIVSLFLLKTKKIDRTTPIPFIPFLVFGIVFNFVFKI